MFSKPTTTYQTTTKEHDGNGDMFQILSDPWASSGSKMFKPNIGATIEKNDKRLDEFSRRNASLPLANLASAWLEVPCPAKVGKATHPSSQR
jgi:hypothetical protein